MELGHNSGFLLDWESTKNCQKKLKQRKYSPIWYVIDTLMNKWKENMETFLRKIFVLQYISHTVHYEVYKWLLLSAMGAGEALISALVPNLHPCQLERGVSSGDLIPEQRRSAFELLVLVCELVFIVIVWMYIFFIVCCLHVIPVDDHFITGLEATW